MFTFVNSVAKQPLPPQVICQILGLDEETVKASFEAGKPPTASEEQLIEAVKKSVDLEDTVEMYAPVRPLRLHVVPSRISNQHRALFCKMVSRCNRSCVLPA